MKKVLIGLLIAILLDIVLLSIVCIVDSETDALARAYIELSSGGKVLNTKDKFREYTQYVQNQKSEENEGDGYSAGSTLREAIVSAAESELEIYMESMKIGVVGGRRYILWYDLLDKLDSTGVSYEEYLTQNPKASGWWVERFDRGVYDNWCAIFTSSVLQKAGAVKSGNVVTDSSCRSMVNKSAKNGQQVLIMASSHVALDSLSVFHKSCGLDSESYAPVEDYTPEPGDVVIFTSDEDSDTTHVGIVVSVNEEKDVFEYIHGNTFGENSQRGHANTTIVARTERGIHDRYVTCFIRPKGE